MLRKTERNLALVILLTAILPLVIAAALGNLMLNSASSVWLRPEVDAQLQRGIDLYKDYIQAVKDDMKQEAGAMAADPALRDAAKRHDAAAAVRALDALFARNENLVSLVVEDEDARTLASKDRGRPLDEQKERKLEVLRPLADGDSAPQLVATFAFDSRYQRELEEAGAVHDRYSLLEKERERVYAPYYEAFAILLAFTAIATFALGFLLARGITKRINQLSSAINEVAAGNLDVRVPVAGSDELTDLARVFNRMLGEMQQSRARIEYLQRIGAWQEMAQRLAHEIKNPLTPIQLAVQECHRKYPGDDARYRALLDTTLEVVEEEVGTLRRLVGNFSSFARLPHAELKEATLRDFLRECSEQLGHLGAELTEENAEDVIVAKDVQVRWEVPPDPMPAAIDRQMMRRVLVNLVRNAVESIRGARPSATPARDGASPARDEATPARDEKAGELRGHVIVRAEARADGIDLLVEDDGPGVPDAMRERVFDPYFTTKAEGTGLGLAIVKKIVVEHNGAIVVKSSERLGGAAFVVSLPPVHSLAIAAATEPAVLSA